MSDPKFFTAEDFDRTRGWGPNDGVLSPEQAARDANAKRDEELERLRARNAFLEDVFKNQAKAINDYVNQGLVLAAAREALDKLAFCKYGDKTLWVEYEDWEHAMFIRDRIDEFLKGGTK